MYRRVGCYLKLKQLSRCLAETQSPTNTITNNRALFASFHYLHASRATVKPLAPNTDKTDTLEFLEAMQLGFHERRPRIAASMSRGSSLVKKAMCPLDML